MCFGDSKWEGTSWVSDRASESENQYFKLCSSTNLCPLAFLKYGGRDRSVLFGSGNLPKPYSVVAVCPPYLKMAYSHKAVKQKLLLSTFHCQAKI